MWYIIFLAITVCYFETNAKLVKLQSAVDLTWPFDDGTVYWTNVQPFVFTKKKAEFNAEGVWYSANEFCAAEHGGTHFDAPYHFNKLGWKVGDVPLSRLIATGIMIDLSEEVKVLQDEATLLPQHLQLWEKEHGPIPDNSVILVYFGWSKYYSEKEYLGIDEHNSKHFPGVSKAAAEWIAQSGKVVGVGLDTASVDPGTDTNFTAHRILSENQIYVLENVKIPSPFPEQGFTLYVMPMKIKEGTGAPLRLVAVPLDDVGVLSRNTALIKTPWYGHVIVVISSVVLYLLYIANSID